MTKAEALIRTARRTLEARKRAGWPVLSKEQVWSMLRFLTREGGDPADTLYVSIIMEGVGNALE